MERDVRGEGGREERKFPSVLSLAQFRARSLTLDPRALLQNSTEMLATQATGVAKKWRFFFCSLLRPWGRHYPLPSLA